MHASRTSTAEGILNLPHNTDRCSRPSTTSGSPHRRQLCCAQDASSHHHGSGLLDRAAREIPVVVQCLGYLQQAGGIERLRPVLCGSWNSYRWLRVDTLEPWKLPWLAFEERKFLRASLGDPRTSLAKYLVSEFHKLIEVPHRLRLARASILVIESIAA